MLGRLSGVFFVVTYVMNGCAALRGDPEFVAPPPSPKYDPALDPVTGRLWIQANEALVVEQCPARGSSNANSAPGARLEDSPPSKYAVELAPRITVQQNCGLVFNEVYDGAFVVRFAKEVCGAAEGSMPEDCTKRFTDMFIARLADRYTGADWTEVERKCRAYPMECKDGRAIERLAITSHNAGIQVWYQRSAEAARASWRQQSLQNAQEAAYAAEQAEIARQREGERRQAVMRAIGNAFAPPPSLSCTSQTWGNTTTTNCH